MNDPDYIALTLFDSSIASCLTFSFLITTLSLQDFLKKTRTKMDGADGRRRWKNIKRRLGLGGFCGALSWGVETLHRTEPLLSNLGPVPSAPPGMNLATALAAERNSRSGNGGPTAKVHVKSLIRLTEETDDLDYRNKRRKISDGQKGGDTDWVCRVCKERNKGAAFIPCGHAFCRVCSRELWAKCGSCPMCKRSIVEILDIY